MKEYRVTESELTGIADAIRNKAGVSIQYEFATGFVEAINALVVGEYVNRYSVGFDFISDSSFVENYKYYMEGEAYVN